MGGVLVPVTDHRLMSPCQNVVIRARGTPSLGGGHLMRCSTLARAFRQLGRSVTFSVNSGALEILPSLQDFPLRFESTEEFLAEVENGGVRGDLLVVDDYSWEAEFDLLCRKEFSTIVSVDDYAHRGYASDIILNQNLGWKPSDYQQSGIPETRYLIGVEYALLRPEFAQVREKGLRERSSLKRVLVNLGLSDQAELEGLVIGVLTPFEGQITVDLVCGNRAQTRKESVPPHIVCHGFTDRISDLMETADLAIGGAGSSSWERCCLGLPAFHIVLSDNQRDIAHHLENAGASQTFYADDQQLGEKLSRALQDLSVSPDQLREMSCAAEKICDGQGAIRSARAMLECRGEVSQEISNN